MKARVGIDGNCGFALLGDDLQEGESEFVEIEEPYDIDAQRFACYLALEKLRVRLNMPLLSWFMDESHPMST
jgi:hypothetical protein